MGQKFLLDNSSTGVQHSVEIDHDGNGFTAVEFTPTRIENEILDTCKTLRGMSQRRGAGLQHAARIPVNTYQAWRKEWQDHYSQHMTWQTFEVMKINSRDNEKLRTGYKRSGSMKL